MALSGLFGGDERKQKEQQMKQEGRLPPGQSLTLKWPVLHYGSVPRFDPSRWDFRVFGLVKYPVKLSWEEFNHLPRSTTRSDFHCVTRWSRFDNHWQGVVFLEIMKLAQPEPHAKYVLIHAEQGYTANVPLSDLNRDNVLLATHHEFAHGGESLWTAAEFFHQFLQHYRRQMKSFYPVLLQSSASIRIECRKSDKSRQTWYSLKESFHGSHISNQYQLSSIHPQLSVGSAIASSFSPAAILLSRKSNRKKVTKWNKEQ